jgi:hypothetical protein
MKTMFSHLTAHSPFLPLGKTILTSQRRYHLARTALAYSLCLCLAPLVGKQLAQGQGVCTNEISSPSAYSQWPSGEPVNVTGTLAYNQYITTGFIAIDGITVCTMTTGSHPSCSAEVSNLAVGTHTASWGCNGATAGTQYFSVIGPPSVLYPAYQVTSIIYAPPGNKSSAGYADTTTNGTTTTVGSSFTNGGSITFTEGIMPFGTGGSASQSFGASTTKSNSHAFTETYTDATGVTNQSVATNPNAINHNEDLFLIWLNPQITVVLTGSTPTSYSLGVQNDLLPDVLEIFANVMEANASGKTTVPATWLNQQTDPVTGDLTPGLASICANLNKTQYLARTCTLSGQCGCVPKDFAPILAMDPLLSYVGTTSPLNADVSGATVCASPTSSSNCRYVPVPASKGGSLQEIETLSGPESQGGNNNCNSFTQTDANTTTETLGGMTTESVTAMFKEGSPVFSLTEAYTLTWTQSQSTGTTTGSGNSQAVNLCSATVGCGEDIAIYEDTEYHTFVFQQPTGSKSCP